MNRTNYPYELKAYLKDPPAMEAGAVGKRGKIALEFSLDKTGKKSYMSNWMRQAPLIVQQELYFDEQMPGMPCVYILSSGGPNVDGDRYEIDLKINKEAFAHISTGAATKIAEMQHNHASMQQNIYIEESGYLEYMPLPVIPCKNSRYITNTLIKIDPTATLFYSEIYTAGREFYGPGEVFQYDLLSICTEAKDLNGNPLFREKMIIEPKKRFVGNIGIMHNYKHFAEIIIITPKKNIEKIVEQHTPYVTLNTALGINTLPNESGVNIKILGNSVEKLKQICRTICSTIRKSVMGKELPKEFAWR